MDIRLEGIYHALENINRYLLLLQSDANTNEKRFRIEDAVDGIELFNSGDMKALRKAFE